MQTKWCGIQRTSCHKCSPICTLVSQMRRNVGGLLTDRSCRHIVEWVRGVLKHKQAIHCLSANLGRLSRQSFRLKKNTGVIINVIISLEKQWVLRNQLTRNYFLYILFVRKLRVRLDNLAEVLPRPAYLTMSLHVKAVTFSRRKINVTTFQTAQLI